MEAINLEALPDKGAQNLGEHHVVMTLDAERKATAKTIELLDLANRRGEEIKMLRHQIAGLKEELQDSSPDDSLQSELQALEQRVVEAETRAEAKAERVRRLEKKVKRLQGEKKHLINRQKRSNRRQNILRTDHPTIRLGDGEVVVQLAMDQIHVHDPEACTVVSSRPLTEADDGAPQFVGNLLSTLRSEHPTLSTAIDKAINHLGRDWRREHNILLTVDLPNVSPAALKRIWDAGIRFAQELTQDDVFERIQKIQGIGPKTMAQLTKAMKEEGLHG